MVAKTLTFSFQGLEAVPIEVQVHLSAGLPGFTIVGLPDKAVGESRERVRAAIQSMGMAMPPKRITVNLSPANITKEGSHYDLPVALGLLVACGALPQQSVNNYTALGELALDGRILPVPGILPAAMAATSIDKGIICPSASGSEARWAGNGDIVAATSLLELISHFKGETLLPPPEMKQAANSLPPRDMKEIKGQLVARRALEIAAAGGHNMLMSGPPGAGKSLLASCLPGILPNMSPKEILETSMIASIAGALADGAISDKRPFRSPHHSSSMAAMVGGGRRAQPGEISLAHNGVLFLDELPEFPRQVLETLRQPLETRQISIARAEAHVTYPANFQFIAAMNPCRCGYLGDAARECAKAPSCGQDYQNKLSGPLLDRIDLHVEVAAVNTLEMFDMAEGESSAVVAARIKAARERQSNRYENIAGVRTNSNLGAEEIEKFAMPDEKGINLLRQATDKLGLSMRAFHRVLKTARTIADLAASDKVKSDHVAEALTFRPLRYST